MTHVERIAIFEHLGSEFNIITSPNYSGAYTEVIEKAQAGNSWFTPTNIQFALNGIAGWLTSQKLQKWLAAYPIPANLPSKHIGIVAAGNIPLVGFHDMLSALILGYRVTLKLSSRDQHLYKLTKQLLQNISAETASLLEFTDGHIGHTDAIIATGSDNTSRYFEYYFANRPHIIRKNRHSLAILTGNESDEDLYALGHDIFTYFGLGCRNVSLLLLPQGFELAKLFKAFEPWQNLTNHNKYANNYDYQKAGMALNNIPYFDTGFALFREFNQLASPISVTHFMYYDTANQVETYVNSVAPKIQCCVSKTKWPFNTYEPGMAQLPALTDYADNVDTVQFLLNLNN